MKINHRITREQRRTRRVRAKVKGTTERPRLSVHRSNKGMYLQVIDGSQAKTVASVNSLNFKVTGTKTEKAKKIATELAEQLKKIKITKLVFDRGGFRYHGRVEAVAEVMREKGMEV